MFELLLILTNPFQNFSQCLLLKSVVLCERRGFLPKLAALPGYLRDHRYLPLMREKMDL